MSEDILEQKILFRAIKVAYFLALLFGVISSVFLGFAERPQKYLDRDKSILSCNDGRRYTLSSLDINLWEQDTQLDGSNRMKAGKACAEEYGFIPDLANYQIDYVERTVGGSWGLSIFCWSGGILIVYVVLNLIRETLNYLFFGRHFQWDWVKRIKLVL